MLKGVNADWKEEKKKRRKADQAMNKNHQF
jgi:hypothetical protein